MVITWHGMTVSEYGGLEPLKIQNEIQGSTMKLREETNEKKKKKQKQREQNSQALIHTGFHHYGNRSAFS